MAALDFPASPSNGQQFTGPGGVVWVYDGTKSAWVSGSLATGTYTPLYGNVGRNLIHNSMFNIAQRGAGPFTGGSPYTLDRWTIAFASDAISFVQGAFFDAGRAAIGDEEAAFYLGNTFTGNAAATAFNFIAQRIENVRRLAGKTVIVSFWAVASAGTPKLGISLDQGFGTGGSPSASVLNAGQSVTIGTTYARYSVTLAVPSVAGKTFGTTAGTDFTQLDIWYSAGSNFATRSGGVGVQSGTVNIWGVQLELGTVATPLEKLDPVTQLQQCQRFYQTGGYNVSAYQLAGTGVNVTISLPASMRVTPPTTTITPTATTNASAPTIPAASNSQLILVLTATATGAVISYGTFTASADL